ncbi:hypothetical protein ADU76_12535 [Clostridium botulinum]|nr:hypothetical protein ADU76_12535 [Clostridium botulinum]
MIFDYKVNPILESSEIYEVLNIYFLIKKYVNSINTKIIDVFGIDDNKESTSAFDEYDKENGYIDYQENEKINIYDSYLDILNTIFNISIRECKNSLKETLDISILDLLDYIKFQIDIKNNQDNEDYTKNV